MPQDIPIRQGDAQLIVYNGLQQRTCLRLNSFQLGTLRVFRHVLLLPNHRTLPINHPPRHRIPLPLHDPLHKHPRLVRVGQAHLRLRLKPDPAQPRSDLPGVEDDDRVALEDVTHSLAIMFVAALLER